MLDTGQIQSGLQMPETDLYKALAEGRWHGHVRPHISGSKARCGGVGLCSTCQREAELLKALGQ